MFGSFYKIGKYAWVQDVRGNFVCLEQREAVATVFSTPWEGWQIIFHDPPQPGIERWAGLLQYESFDNPQAAMSRAGDLLDAGKEHQNCRQLSPQAFKNAFLPG